jgi:hypothetical protein
MATFFIAEHATALEARDGKLVQVIQQPPLRRQTITVAASAAACTAFGKDTAIVRISTDTACHFAFGASPTATTSADYLPADGIEYHGVTGVASQKVSVIAH